MCRRPDDERVAIGPANQDHLHHDTRWFRCTGSTQCQGARRPSMLVSMTIEQERDGERGKTNDH